MIGWFRSRSFSFKLVFMMGLLIMLTTLSAGVPAYWVTNSRLEQQTWAGVDNARQATLSLLHAEQAQLTNLVRLLAERPTLQRLLRQPDTAALSGYLHDFQTQSQLDWLLLCRDSQPLAGSSIRAACVKSGSRFEFIQDRPAVVAALPVVDSNDDQPVVAVAGRWLQGPLLNRLSANTGALHTILRVDGLRLTSNLPLAGAAPPPVALPPAPRTFEVNGQQFYAVVAPLTDSSETATLFVEVALPTNQLVATENQALLILVISTGAVAILGMLLTLWSVGQLTAPLKQLTDIAQKISRGELMTPIPTFDDPIEVNTLAAALQQSQLSMLEALQASSQARDWLNTLVQSIVEGVVTFDTAGQITFFSQGAETLTGWTTDDALGHPVDDVFRMADDSQAKLSNALPQPGRKQQLTILNKKGQEINLAVTQARLPVPGSRTPQVALVLRDVTHEEALYHLHSYFLANISHEFRTPLSTLNASLELLMDNTEELSAAEMRELLKPMALSLRGLQSLIDNLLATSRIEAGRFVIQRRRVDFNVIIQDALQLVQLLLERRQQTISLTKPLHLPPLLVDPTRLTQVLVNLLVNASKYSPPGQSIDVQLERRPGILRVTVADRGPGIAPHDQLNLFRRFVRLASNHQEQYGVGLGLYVVKSAVEAHGGQVGVNNRPGGGSMFWFELPLEDVTDENSGG